jgi:hypothetical protein
MAKFKDASGDKANEVVVPLLVDKGTAGVEVSS